MSAPQNFRSAFKGFNREDVVHYLEYINSKHTYEINQLTAANEELRAAAQQRPLIDQEDIKEYLQSQGAEPTAELVAERARCQELTQQLEAEKMRCQELEQQLEAEKMRCQELEQQLDVAGQHGQADSTSAESLVSEELEAYRRAERIEREARERSELIYFQANCVLSEATAKVDSLSADLTDMADQVMSQLTQLQIAVSSSKQALQDASSIMGTIRPNK